MHAIITLAATSAPVPTQGDIPLGVPYPIRRNKIEMFSVIISRREFLCLHVNTRRRLLKESVEKLTQKQIDALYNPSRPKIVCPFQSERLRDYPGCFEDCPDTEICPHRGVAGKNSLSGKRGVPRGKNGGNAPTSPTLQVKDLPPDQQGILREVKE
jgi:hypothetical protein